MCRWLTRRVGAALTVAVVAAAALASAATASPVARTVSLRSLESGVLAQINTIRAEHGLAQLRLSRPLSQVAALHTQEMAVDGYFAHESADGSAFWRRIEGFYPSASVHFWSVGENLLWSSPDIDAEGALSSWMHSPEHRQNLLDPRWRDVGIAAVHASTAPGVYDGRPVTIVTTDFGVRK